jgi:hypothetical protein
MIRIDEIYDHTFWPYIQSKIPLTRLFYCFPFGHTSPDNLLNIGNTQDQANFIYCHDQEPVHHDVHDPLFSSVRARNQDLNFGQGPRHTAFITSEINSNSLTQVCSKYKWTPYYYFFHGWAALDWYRGYDRSFLVQPAESRSPTKTFFSANRIIGGHRLHRIIMMYHLIRRECLDGYFSLPQYCPDSGQSIDQLTLGSRDQFPDIAAVMSKIALPANLPGETDHPMHSCWLSQFESTADSFCYIVTETVATGAKLHLTEKIFRPICLQMPFVLVGTAGGLAYLRSYGFQTFGDFWDESYDDEQDDLKRIDKVAGVIDYLQNLGPTGRQKMHRALLPIIKHNFNHFYSGSFEKILWAELTGMLSQLEKNFAE